LNNSPLIPACTAEKIRRIATEKGYSASAVARSLVTKRTQAIGVVVTSIADPFNGEIVAGIEEMAHDAGYSVILATSQGDPAQEMTVVRSFRERRVDGILVASSRVGAHYIPLLEELGIPVVLLNNQHPSEFVHSVSIDNANGAFQAAQHLIELGHRRIAYIGDEHGLQSDSERLKGFKKALAQAKLRISEEYIVAGNGKPDGGRGRAEQLFALPTPPTAIFCYNDMTALGVIEAAAARGFVIGDDLSVVGFDDLFFAELLRPPLTTVRQPKEELGKRSMRLLLALLNNERPARRAVVKGELVVRASSGKPYHGIVAGKNSATKSR
jgi:DNA-binding LacI/PurR family transcriptional regulator